MLLLLMGKEETLESRDNSLTVVYGPAVLQESMHNRVESSDVNDIIDIIDSKNHLKHNISKIRLGRINNYDADNSKFKHEIEFIFNVSTAPLLKSPRVYLWKHLGTSEWTLRDGRLLSFVRIHRK